MVKNNKRPHQQALVIVLAYLIKICFTIDDYAYKHGMSLIIFNHNPP